MADTRIDVVKAVMGAWGRHDIDELLTHIHPDIEWHYQVGSRPVNGVADMRKLLERLKDHQLNSRWRVVRHAEADDALFIEAIEDYTNPAGARVRAPYMGVYEFDGLVITAWRDYVDLGLIMKGEAGDELDPWLEDLVSPDRR